jgi:phytoene dehydrogenase-like protein
MSDRLPRREFLTMLASAFPAAAFDWSLMPTAHPSRRGRATDYDAIVIGSGLGGLSCAAAFARQGFRPLVLEKHDKPGGYATAFARPGGFVFDVSLHSTVVDQRSGRYDLIPGFPEITDVEFVPHPTLFRAIFPEHDIRVAQHDPSAYMETLAGLFPQERAGIAGLFDDMTGLADDVRRLSAARGQADMSRFPVDYPHLFRFYAKTWGDMVDARLTDPKLKAIVSAQCGYYGLPPSKLASFYYAMPFMSYLTQGGFYPRGRSQDLSNAFVRYIEQHGGSVLLNTPVERILREGGAACGVRAAGGREYRSRAVISNANPFDTFGRLLGDEAVLAQCQADWRQYSVSLSSFQVFLGLKEDLVGKLGITDSELFVATGYDPDEDYARNLAGDVEHGGFGVSLYDNIYRGYSPAGKNTVNVMTLQGYGPWEQYEADYFAGRKEAYRRAKEQLAAVLIRKAEEKLLPGLSAAVEVMEVGTPLTNRRYTGHHRGAIYGWDQTVNNSGGRRVGHATPVPSLYLAGAWSRPGHGYTAVMMSGLECFGEVAGHWS